MTIEIDRSRIIEQFLDRRGDETKRCVRCAENKSIRENFGRKIKWTYMNRHGKRVPRPTPAVECTSHCNSCERIRQVEGIHRRIVNDPAYRERYYARFEKLEAAKKANPEMQRYTVGTELSSLAGVGRILKG